MELIIELPTLLPPGWLVELQKQVSRVGLNSVHIVEVIPPVGTAGAGFMSKLKVASEVAGDIASVLALANAEPKSATILRKRSHFSGDEQLKLYFDAADTASRVAKWSHPARFMLGA
jgi:hypothetical protein